MLSQAHYARGGPSPSQSLQDMEQLPLGPTLAQSSGQKTDFQRSQVHDPGKVWRVTRDE